MKKRIDANGNVIETRQDGIGAPKVSWNAQALFCCFTVAYFVLLTMNIVPNFVITVLVGITFEFFVIYASQLQ